MHTFPKTITLFAAALMLAPAVSAAESEQRTTGVTYNDLDLTTEAGRAQLEQRIDHAAKQVCGMGESTVGTRIRSREARACYTQARRQLDQHFAEILRDSQLGG